VKEHMTANPAVIACLCLLCRCFCFSGESAEDVLKNMEKSYAIINDITFGFTQKMTIIPTGETETLSGDAAFKKPDKFRITDKKPQEQTIVSDGKNVYLYSKRHNQVTVEEAGADAGGIPRQFFDFSSVISGLRDGYDISVEKEDAKHIVLSCAPKHKDGTPDSSVGSKVKLWVTKNGYLLDRMETSTDATVSDIAVSKVKTNPGMSDSMFKFNIPKGAEVVTPR